MKRFLYLILVAFFMSCTQHGEELITIENFQSDYVSGRTIQVYLPSSYSVSDYAYSVLYMHDGQMLFDSTTTWNGQEWGVDETITSLIENGEIAETTVVAIWNGGSQLRHPEYFPQKPFETLPQEIIDSIYQLGRNKNTALFANEIQSDNYLKFLVEEVKPFIDSTYRTNPEMEHTFIAGSSMGGLISMYAICEYPEVFKGAACLSTHWPGIFSVDNNPIPQAFFTYLASNLPDPSNHKFYFDHGTETLDALYEPFQQIADSLIRQAGYNDNNFKTIKFEGDPHDENAWKNRLHIPMTFLLSKD